MDDGERSDPAAPGEPARFAAPAASPAPKHQLLPAVAPSLDNPTVELPSGAYPADYANPRFGGLANLTGVPAISVPVGLGEGGMPIGLQLHGAWGRDELLLDAAEALERATGRRHVEATPALATT